MRNETPENEPSLQNRLLFWLTAALAPDAVTFHVDSARWLRQGRIAPEPPRFDDTLPANDPENQDSGQAA